MPILVCPNCQGGMNEITRNGVSIDVCPKCKGVWLDDGELQKLLAPVRELKADMDDERRYYEQPRQHRQQPQPHYRDDDDAYKYGHGKYRKKKSMLDMFDIFD